MNSAATDEESVQVKEGPGARLKSLREAQEMDLQRAASLLHLSDEKLIALEADDYRSLGGSVFVQGYLRNYARLLGVPVEPLIKAYHKNDQDQGRYPDLRVTQVRHEVRSSHTLVRLMTWFIVIGLIALVVVWWRGYLQWPLSSQEGEVAAPAAADGEGLPQVDIQQPLLPDSAPLPTFNDQGEAELVLPPRDPESEAPPAPALLPEPPPAARDQSLPQPPAASQPPVSDLVVSEMPLTVTAAPTAPAAEEQMSTTGSSVVIEFTGTSWTKINDSSGSFRIMGEIRAGSRRELGGTPPYEIVLGNALAAKIMVDGEPFDITPYIRGNVARFNLDPGR